MASTFLDPLQLWRDAVTKLENEVNSLATGSTKSQEVVRALHQFSNVSHGMEQVIEKVIGGYLRRANLPSRRDVVELGESMRRIEAKIDRLLPAEIPASAPRPPRTRRPAAAAAAPPAEPLAVEPSAPVAKPAPAARAKRRTTRRKGG